MARKLLKHISALADILTVTAACHGQVFTARDFEAHDGPAVISPKCPSWNNFDSIDGRWAATYSGVSLSTPLFIGDDAARFFAPAAGRPDIWLPATRGDLSRNRP